MMEYDKTKKTKTAEQALRTLMNLCAKSEKSTGDAYRLLFHWGVEPGRHDEVVRQLVAEKFIDNRRYAEAFVREKLNLGGWGAHKIRAALRVKRIEEPVIEAALLQADPETMAERLELQLRRKMGTLKAKDGYDLRAKLLRFGAGRGYDFDRVSETVDKLIKEQE